MRLSAMGFPPLPRHPRRAGLAGPAAVSGAIIAGPAIARHGFVTRLAGLPNNAKRKTTIDAFYRIYNKNIDYLYQYLGIT
jgi:hypothetical protein